MESAKKKSLSIEIPNYQGPLEVLLDLAKTQKVDLANISITHNTTYGAAIASATTHTPDAPQRVLTRQA